MSPQQTALIQQILSILGMVATTLGWMTPSEVSTWTTTIMSAIGPVMALGGLIWSLISHTKAAIVTQTATLPEVRAVVTEQTPAGVALARSDTTPSNVVVGQTPGSPVPPPPPHP